VGFELGERHLDGVQVRAVGRQEQHPGALGLDGGFGIGTFVGGQIVEDDDVAFRQSWCQLGFNPGIEDDPVHRLIDDEGRGQAPMAQSGDKGLGFPVTEWGLRPKPQAFERASAQPGHLGGGAGFVDEDETVALAPQPRLPTAPGFTRRRYFGAILFRRQQRFFYI